MLSSNTRTFCALVRRDIKVLSRNIKDQIINQAIFVFCKVFAYGKLFVILGFPLEVLPPTLIGLQFWILPLLGFNKSLETYFDLENTRKIGFELGLPLGVNWLIARYIVSYFLYIAGAGIPMIILAGFLLRGMVDFSQANFLFFALICLLSFLMFSILFLLLVFGLSFKAFSDHLWSRILMPLMFLSPVFFSFGSAKEISPKLGLLLLLNPLTYCIEGTNAALLGQEQFLSIYLCLTVIVLTLCLMLTILKRCFKRRLDHA